MYLAYILSMTDTFHAWMPITKSYDGKLVGILSDTSLDRDDEFMTKELIVKWSKNKTLKALANHENKMQSWVGGWSNLKVVEKGENIALTAEPWFFSGEANPLASQIKKQVEEAIANGESPGISIGALPLSNITKEIDGKIHRGYSDAELLEATWVPIQSNRNATFGHIAKQFDIDLTKPKEVEDCVQALMNDPEFHPQEGRSKEESAWAVCQSKKKEGCKGCKFKSEEKKEEVIEVQKLEEPQKMVEEELVKESPLEAQVQKEVEKVEEVKKEENSEVQKLLDENKVLKEKIETLEKQAVLKATVEVPSVVKATEMEMTIENLLRKKAGIL
jgi:hypothetical protein